MARGPKYAVKHSWGWMMKLALGTKKRRARVARPAFANLRGLGKPSLLAASALGTVLIVSPVTVPKAYADTISNDGDYPFSATFTGPANSLVVQNSAECTVNNATCIDLVIENGGTTSVLFDQGLGPVYNLKQTGTGDAIAIEAWDDDSDISIQNINTASEIVADGYGISVYADGYDQLGDVNITWAGTITSHGADGVEVGNQNADFKGNVGSVTINTGDITTDTVNGGRGVDVFNIHGTVDVATGNITSFEDGISIYNVNDAVDVTVNGSIDVTGNIGGDGVYVGTVNGNVDVDVTGDITTNGDDAVGVHVQNVDGDVTITAGNITTNGAGSDGVNVDPINGDVSITVLDISTDGAGADGIEVDDVLHAGADVDGNLTIMAGDITTDGANADGIDIYHVEGFVDVTTGDIQTGTQASQNNNANGVLIGNVAGGVTVVTGNIDTFGTWGSDGVETSDTGAVDVTTKDVTTHGINADGFDISMADGDVTIDSGNIETNGNFADGVDVTSVDGNVDVTVNGNISTNGTGADGVTIGSELNIPFLATGPVTGNVTGDVTVDVTGDINVEGNWADGIQVEGVGSALLVLGIPTLISGSDVTITAGNITTSGTMADGVEVNGVFGNVSITTEDIETNSTMSNGVLVGNVADSVTVVTGNITTEGLGSDGVEIYNVLDDVSVTVNGDIDATGNWADGIQIERVGIPFLSISDVTVTANDISTNGMGADGVDISYVSGEVDVTVGDVTTNGSDSNGVLIGNVGRGVDVTTGNITTDGAGSDGIEIYNVLSGGVDVTVNGDIHTNGNWADGIQVDNVTGNVNVTAGNITTNGTGADGVTIDPIFGDVTITVADVTTSGNWADGVQVEGVFGDLDITAGDITTDGTSADGIDVADVTGHVIVHVGDIQTGTGIDQNPDANGVLIGNVGGGVSVTTGNIDTFGLGSDGIEIYDVATGNIDVTVNGDISTNGNWADGVQIEDVNGDVNVAVNGNISTDGIGADGVTVGDGWDYAGNIQASYTASGINGDIDINVTGDISTEGNWADGIQVQGVGSWGYNVGSGYYISSENDVTVTANNISTNGDDADGIDVREVTGDVNITVSGNVTTNGDDANGILTDDVYGTTTINVNGNIHAFGDSSDGIDATGYDTITVNVSGNSAVTSDEDDGIDLIVYADDGNANAVVNNHGFVTGGDYAIDAYAYGGDVIVNNFDGARVRGAIDLYSYWSDAEVNNDGVFDLVGDSYVYGYNSAVFNNTGRVQVTDSDGQYASIDMYSDLYTAEFHNEGLVTLVDDDPTDVLAIGDIGGDGRFVFHGASNSTLAVDAFLAGPADSEADQLWIYGDVTGTTEIVVNDVEPSSPGAYNPDGVLVVWVEGDTNLGDFTLADGPIDKGLFQYDLYLTGNDHEWVLASVPGEAAHQAPELVTAIQNVGHAAMAMGIDRLGAIGNCAAAGYNPGVNPTADVPGCDDVGGSVWLSVLGRGFNWDNNSSSKLYGQRSTFDVSYDQTMWGIIGGADGGQSWTNGSGGISAAYGGIMGGYMSSSIDFDGSGSGDFSGGLLGIYGGYEQDGWHLNGVLSGQFGTLSYNHSTLGGYGGADDSDVWALGGVIDTGYRIGAQQGVSGMWFEPFARVSILATSIDDADWAGNNVNFDDNTSVRGGLGAKVGVDNGAGFSGYVEASIWNEFGDDPSISISNPIAPTVNVDAAGLGVWGDIGAGIDYNMDGWAIGAKGDVAYNSDMWGYGGSLKVEFSW